MVERLKPVALRKIWPNEARDFTKWLRDNLDGINEATRLSLKSAEKETPIGDFSADLVAKDEDGRKVIIENQLEESDHDHLGKLLTYLSAVDASAAVWIVSKPRQEHVRAVDWLNRSSSASFYLLRVEAFRIGDSEPAPKLSLVAGPGAESKKIAKTRREEKERDKNLRRFFYQLLEVAGKKTDLHAGVSPGNNHWVSAGAGRSGLSLSYVIRQDDGHVELYVDFGKGKKRRNKAVFDQLHANRKEIERAFGKDLIWQRLDDKRACRIKKDLNAGGLKNERSWPRMHAVMVDVMISFEKALRPYIDRLRV